MQGRLQNGFKLKYLFRIILDGTSDNDWDKRD